MRSARSLKNGLYVDSNGTKNWYLNDNHHREDGPAVEYPDGTKFWYLYGEPHREGGPAREYPDGTKYWFLNGKRHREDGPAIERSDGTKFWYLNDHQITLETKSNDPKVRALQKYMKVHEVIEE
jgi:hypothetical protein